MSNTFIAQGAHVIGKVTIGENVGIWYNAVVRGDMEEIIIGDNSNIQDNCILVKVFILKSEKVLQLGITQLFMVLLWVITLLLEWEVFYLMELKLERTVL